MKDTNVAANQKPELHHEPMKSALIWADTQSYYRNIQIFRICPSRAFSSYCIQILRFVLKSREKTFFKPNNSRLLKKHFLHWPITITGRSNWIRSNRFYQSDQINQPIQFNQILIYKLPNLIFRMFFIT